MVVGRGTNNYLIRLGEVAKVELGPVDVFSISRSNGEYGIRMEIIKQPGASTLDVAKQLRAEVANELGAHADGTGYAVESTVLIASARR